MGSIAIIWLLAGALQGFAVPPADADLFQVGIYTDEGRTTTCATGPAGATFPYSVWAWVPGDLGLAYITLRFAFPENLDLSRRPDFHDLVSDVIITEYAEDTVEWNLLFDDCPSGWIEVLRQECVLLDVEPSLIRILAGHSMMRDCTFVLNDVVVLDELLINDPGCMNVSVARPTWGGVKIWYR